MKKLLSTFPLRLPTSLKAAVAEISNADGTSINQFVTKEATEEVAAMKPPSFSLNAHPRLTSLQHVVCYDATTTRRTAPPEPDDSV